MKSFKTFFGLLKDAYNSWNANDPWAKGAIIAYYALFSLPSLLIIVVTLAGYFFGQKDVQDRITNQISGFIGPEAAKSIENMITNAALDDNSTLAIVFGVGILLFAATGVFFQLKKAMNNIWGVAEKKENFLRMLLDRAISFGMVLVIGFLLLLSMIISAVVTFLGETIEEEFPSAITAAGLEGINYSISFVIITLLFAAIFKILPDVVIKWKTTLYGAALTTVFFLIGEYLISLYFGQSNPGSVYGGASSVVLILLWVNYICLIMFFGAEFTVQYALHKNDHIIPNRFGQPYILHELKRLEEKKFKYGEDREILDHLRELRQQQKESKS